MNDYYAILDVASCATTLELRQAYRKQAVLHHPDKNPDRIQDATEKFKLIGEAYEVLRDERLRAAYDSGRRFQNSFCRQDNHSWSHSGGGGMGEWNSGKFSFSQAKDIFREVFGDDFVTNLAQAAKASASFAKEASEVAAPHIKAAAKATASAADGAVRITAPHVQAAASATASVVGEAVHQCSSSPLAKSAVAVALSQVEASARDDVLYWQGVVSKRHEGLDRARAELCNFEDACKVSKEKRLRHIEKLSQTEGTAVAYAVGGALVLLMVVLTVWFRIFEERQSGQGPVFRVSFYNVGIVLLVFGTSLLECRLFLRALDAFDAHVKASEHHTECLCLESKKSGKMRVAVTSLHESLRSAQHQKSNATDRRDGVWRDRLNVRSEGVSLGNVATVGLHYLGRFTGTPKLLRAAKAALTWEDLGRDMYTSDSDG